VKRRVTISLDEEVVRTIEEPLERGDSRSAVINEMLREQLGLEA
jgi:metal-responsive CopG/Arc/MetJ family transcriptional regulator